MRALAVVAVCLWVLGGGARRCASAAPAVQTVEADARGVVDAWIAAQNRADFAAYESLYAKQFFGVRKSGDRERRFDRAGWLADRRRMFVSQNPMKVEAANVSVSVVADGASIELLQRYQQGTYRDEGRKQLYLRREDGGLRIADERLLESIMEGAKKGRQSFAWTKVVGIVTPEGVVVSSTADKSWATGKPRRRVKKDGREVARWAIQLERVPAAMRALVGTPLELIDAQGKSCEASVKSLALIAAQDHSLQKMEGEEDVIMDVGEPSAIEHIPPRLIAELDRVCKKAFIARVKGSSDPVVVARKRVDVALEQAAIKATRALPAFRAIAAGGKWVEETIVKTADVQVEGATQTWVTITMYGPGGCANDGQALWALFAVTPSPKGPSFKLLNAPGTEAVVPSLFLDVDGDGWPEVLFQRGGSEDLGYDDFGGVVRRRNGIYQDYEKVRDLYLGCPC